MKVTDDQYVFSVSKYYTGLNKVRENKMMNKSKPKNGVYNCNLSMLDIIKLEQFT